MVKPPSSLFKLKSLSSHYARCKNPVTRVIFSRDMGKGIVRQKVQRAKAYWKLRQAMNKDWRSFHLLADTDFPKELSIDFWSRWFELLVYSFIKNQKLRLVNQSITKHGAPDFLVETSDGSQFAVEATMITAGQTGKNSSAIPAPDFEGNATSVVQDVSEIVWENHNGQLVQVANPDSQSKLALRFTTVIDSKNRQINKWQAKGVLNHDAPVVLAIGTAQATAETNLRILGESELLLALYGVGNKFIHFSKSGEVIDDDTLPTHRHESTVSNHGGSDVPVGLFNDPNFCSISAVLLCEDQLFEYGAGKKLLCLNANAAAPVTQNLFGNIPVVEQNNTFVKFTTQRLQSNEDS